MTKALAIVAAMVVAGLLLLCNGRRDAPRTIGGATDPCDASPEYPCTWDEVEPAVVTLTKRIAEIAMHATLETPDLGELAEFLAGVPGMAEVVLVESGVRFRLDGGRPAWVVLPSELDHHFPERTARGVAWTPPPRHLGPTAVGASTADPVAGFDPFRWLSPRPLHAAMQEDGQEVAGEPGSGKHALVLAPFEYELGYSADVARRIDLIRDYREEHGGSLTYHADLYALDDNPEPAALEQASGTRSPSGAVVFDDFLNWSKYNLIVVFTHGGRVECARPVPVGGQKVDFTKNYDGPLCPLITAGRAKQASYGGYRGVELYYGAGIIRYTPQEPPDTRYASPDPRGWEATEATHPGLTPTERAWCIDEALAGAVDPVTAGGKPCYAPAWLHRQPLIALWTPFFERQYPDGLERAVVFLAACHSGYREVLPKLFARSGNEAITVLGVDTVVNAGDAAHVIGETLRLIDLGYHSTELIDRLKELDRTKHLTGLTMAPGEEAAPGRPPEIVQASTSSTHGRDIVELVYPVTGLELTDGSTVRVVGVPGDGKPDSLEVRAALLGVSEPDGLGDFALRVSVVGGEPGPWFAVSEPGDREGAWEHAGPLGIGRDVQPDEVVDLEIEATLPGGGISRWVYEDVRLRSSICGFTATVSGSSHAGTYEGAAVVLGNAILLKDGRADLGVMIELPIEESAEDAGLRPGTVRAEGPHPTTVGISAGSDPAGFRAGGWQGDARESATIRLIRSDGNSANPAEPESSIEAEVTGQLRWCNPRQDGEDACRRPTYLGVRIRLRAVPFAVPATSPYQRCANSWKDRWYGKN